MKKEFVAPVTPTTQHDLRTCPAMRALERLTPGGSEYIDDIPRCVEHVREARHLMMKAMVNIKRSAGVTPTPPTDPRAMKWISVEERRPRPNCPVLFWTTSETFESGYFRADYHEPIRWECERTGPQDERIDFFEGQVTHWMIPAAPGSTPRCGKNMGNDLLVIPCDLAAGHEGPCERNVWPVAPGSTSGPTCCAYHGDGGLEEVPCPKRVVISPMGGDEVEGGATPQPAECPTCKSADKTVTCDPFVEDGKTFVPIGPYVNCADPWHMTTKQRDKEGV